LKSPETLWTSNGIGFEDRFDTPTPISDEFDKRSNWMAARTWEDDFRYPAIQASMNLIRDGGYLDDPFRCPSSFCIPVAKKPAVGLTPGKISLFAVVMGFLLLGSGAVLASIAVPQNAPKAQENIPLLCVAGFSSLCGLGCFFIPLCLDRQIVGWLIGERGRRLIERAGMIQIMAAEASDADRNRMKLSIDGDDHVLIFPDADRHRILIEGTAARYQICAEDVEAVERFEFMNYVGVQLVCRVGEARLFIAIARVSLALEFIHQLPVLFFLRGRISNKLYTRFSEVLF
jgi:hypothetical protein